MIEAARLRSIPTDQLRVLNSLIVEEMRSRQRMEAVKAQTKFHVGQIVQFDSRKRGRTIQIRVEKFNPTTISAGK